MSANRKYVKAYIGDGGTFFVTSVKRLDDTRAYSVCQWLGSWVKTVPGYERLTHGQAYHAVRQLARGSARAQH